MQLQATGLYYVVMKLILSVFILIIVMWTINIAGWQDYNFVLAFAGLFVLISIMLAPKMIYAFFGLGALVSGLQDRDITQGAVAGISDFFRLMFGVIFYFTACATVLTMIPFKQFPGAFWGFAMLIIVVMTMFIYLRISTGQWMKRIVVAAVVALSLVLAAKLLLPEGVIMLGSNSYQAFDLAAKRKAELIKICSENPTDSRCQEAAPQTPVVRRPVIIPAARAGEMIAPAGRWSDWYSFTPGHCVYGWGDNPSGNAFRIRWMDNEGETWSYDGRQATNLKAFSVRSNSNSPVRVQYEVRPRINGYCQDL